MRFGYVKNVHESNQKRNLKKWLFRAASTLTLFNILSVLIFSCKCKSILKVVVVVVVVVVALDMQALSISEKQLTSILSL